MRHLNGLLIAIGLILFVGTLAELYFSLYDAFDIGFAIMMVIDFIFLMSIVILYVLMSTVIIHGLKGD